VYYYIKYVNIYYYTEDRIYKLYSVKHRIPPKYRGFPNDVERLKDGNIHM